MTGILTEIVLQSWGMTLQMAPFLLFGFAMAGVLAQLISRRWVETHLAEEGIKGIIKAVTFGIPLPLCSCGVLPVAQSLRRHGASRGAVSAFLISTPQTGADSILATYSLMGWPFTIARVVADLFSGILCGFGVDLYLGRKGGAKDLPREGQKAESCGGQEDLEACCGSEGSQGSETARRSLAATLKSILKEGFIDLPRDLARPLLLGLLLGGILTTVFPEGIIRESIGNPLLTFFAVTLLSIPLYVCATGSIPLAYGLMAAGLSPGATLVFLIIGPATNTATVTTLVKMLGMRATTLHLTVLIASSWAMGGIFDLVTSQGGGFEMIHGEHEGHTLVQSVSAVFMMLMLAVAIIPAHYLRPK